MRLAYVLPLVGALVACRTEPLQTCASDGDCGGGRCLQSPFSDQKFCAYPNDGFCASGLRWGPYAADGLARSCVIESGGDGGIRLDLSSRIDATSGASPDLAIGRFDLSGPHVDATSGASPDLSVGPVDGSVRPFDFAVPDLTGVVIDLAQPGWSPQASPTTADLRGISGLGNFWLVAVGTSGTILESKGDGQWLPLMPITFADLNGVWGWKGGMYAVGNGATLLYTQNDAFGAWTRAATPTSAGDLYATFGGFSSVGADVFLVGQGQQIYSFDAPPAGSFQVWGPTVGPSLRGVWMTDPNDVYVVGDFNGMEGTLLRNNSGVFMQDPIGTSFALLGVWGSSASDVYVVGDGGTILHARDGMTFIPEPSGTTSRLRAVWGSSASDVWAVGDAGTILHSTGGGVWQPQPSSTFRDLYSIYGSASNDVYVVGAGGTILHHS